MFENFEFSLPIILIGIGITLFTIFIHRHTFVQDYESGSYRRVRFPLWLLLVFIVVGNIPIVNVVAFVVGAFIYIMRNFERQDFIFSFRNITGKYPEHTGKFLKKIVNFFNKDLS
jgi:hypothetical protein